MTCRLGGGGPEYTGGDGRSRNGQPVVAAGRMQPIDAGQGRQARERVPGDGVGASASAADRHPLARRCQRRSEGVSNVRQVGVRPVQPLTRFGRAQPR